jgi:hypothetical protein
MSKIDILLNNYENVIAIPWRDLAPAQRVIFAVYQGMDERRLRAKICEFEIVTRNLSHGWAHFDLTNSFAQWMNSQKYAKSYYQKPILISNILQRYEEYIGDGFYDFIKKSQVTDEDVVAISGVGSVFGFIKVHDLVERLAPKVKGRLLVFFPGSYEDNNYRLLDGYDGWNYHALPITCNEKI